MGVEFQLLLYGDGTKGRAGASGKQEVLGGQHWLSWSVEGAAVGLVPAGTLWRWVC